ncbi:hypothetical protein Tco_0466423 [Tanacetum coccineum]
MESRAQLPIELEHRAYWALKHANFDLKTAGDHRKLQLNELNEIRDQAYENSLIYRRIRLKIKNRIFNVGWSIFPYGTSANNITPDVYKLQSDTATDIKLTSEIDSNFSEDSVYVFVPSNSRSEPLFAISLGKSDYPKDYY